MNKLSTVVLGSLLATSISSAAYAAPTRTFFTETANIAANGSTSLDLEYGFTTSAAGTGVRIGALGGEILLNNNNTGFLTTSIGYKKVVQKNLAAYGILSYLNDDAAGTSYTDFAIGAAYTMKQNNMIINLNGEMITDDSGALRGGDTTVFVKASIEIPTKQMLANSSFIAELAVENSDFVETSSALGLRWQPSKTVTADLIIYADEGDTTIGIPGYVKLNLAF